MELGAPLFIREIRRVFLTDFGQEMVTPMQNIFDRAHAAEQVAGSFRLSKRKLIRLGMMATLSHRKFAKLMSRYNDQNNDTETEVTEMSWPDLHKALEDDKIELAITSLSRLRLDAFKLWPLNSYK